MAPARRKKGKNRDIDHYAPGPLPPARPPDQHPQSPPRGPRIAENIGWALHLQPQSSALPTISKPQPVESRPPSHPRAYENQQQQMVKNTIRYFNGRQPPASSTLLASHPVAQSAEDIRKKLEDQQKRRVMEMDVKKEKEERMEAAGGKEVKDGKEKEPIYIDLISSSSGSEASDGSPSNVPKASKISQDGSGKQNLPYEQSVPIGGQPTKGPKQHFESCPRPGRCIHRKHCTTPATCVHWKHCRQFREQEEPFKPEIPKVSVTPRSRDQNSTSVTKPDVVSDTIGAQPSPISSSLPQRPVARMKCDSGPIASTGQPFVAVSDPVPQDSSSEPSIQQILEAHIFNLSRITTGVIAELETKLDASNTLAATLQARNAELEKRVEFLRLRSEKQAERLQLLQRKFADQTQGLKGRPLNTDNYKVDDGKGKLREAHLVTGNATHPGRGVGKIEAMEQMTMPMQIPMPMMLWPPWGFMGGCGFKNPGTNGWAPGGLNQGENRHVMEEEDETLNDEEPQSNAVKRKRTD